MDGLLDRRDLLKAAAAGALVVPLGPAGAQPQPPRVITKAAAGSPNGGDGQITAFLRIGTDGVVTFASPVSELGQGTHRGLAMIVADELDVPLAAVRVVTGQPEPALRLQPVGEMYAGASFGIRFSHDRIRRACAQARGALVEAAAASARPRAASPMPPPAAPLPTGRSWRPRRGCRSGANRP